MAQKVKKSERGSFFEPKLVLKRRFKGKEVRHNKKRGPKDKAVKRK